MKTLKILVTILITSLMIMNCQPLADTNQITQQTVEKQKNNSDPKNEKDEGSENKPQDPSKDSDEPETPPEENKGIARDENGEIIYLNSTLSKDHLTTFTYPNFIHDCVELPENFIYTDELDPIFFVRKFDDRIEIITIASPAYDSDYVSFHEYCMQYKYYAYRLYIMLTVIYTKDEYEMSSFPGCKPEGKAELALTAAHELKRTVFGWYDGDGLEIALNKGLRENDPRYCEVDDLHDEIFNAMGNNSHTTGINSLGHIILSKYIKGATDWRAIPCMKIVRSRESRSKNPSTDVIVKIEDYLYSKNFSIVGKKYLDKAIIKAGGAYYWSFDTLSVIQPYHLDLHENEQNVIYGRPELNDEVYNFNFKTGEIINGVDKLIVVKENRYN
ncbi:MAG: hypothetical protein IJ191_05615 [Treponema sp.]|nr:hypothetical protein [Treponema sp.]